VLKVNAVQLYSERAMKVVRRAVIKGVIATFIAKFIMSHWFRSVCSEYVTLILY